MKPLERASGDDRFQQQANGRMLAAVGIPKDQFRCDFYLASASQEFSSREKGAHTCE
jgi:hypothetical protein